MTQLILKDAKDSLEFMVVGGTLTINTPVIMRPPGNYKKGYDTLVYVIDAVKTIGDVTWVDMTRKKDNHNQRINR